MFSRSTIYDYYWPTLSTIGEQAVLNKEIYAQGTSDDDEVFGYQERYGEYRYKPSLVTGRFRSNATTSLETWHYAQEYSALPVLGPSWIQHGKANVHRTLAVTNEPKIISDPLFKLRHTRQLTVSGESMKGSYLGPIFSDEECAKRVEGVGAQCEVLQEDEFIRLCVGILEKGKAVGWFQGRMEFGPRALGARSIIGDARSPQMQSVLNVKVKFRESFRPFAPSVLREDVSEWFDLDTDSPYMLLVADIAKKYQRPMTDEQKQLFGIEKLNVPRSDIPAITHVDYSARIQTVHKETNPRYHKLLSVFKSRTGCPVLVNTSFNVRGEPIVCTPEDAFRCFMGTGIEALAIGNCLLRKEAQPPSLTENYTEMFDLD